MTGAPLRRVLIVEDEVVVAMLIEDMLADLGCAVAMVASTARQAVEDARACDVDFALLDINLGEGETSFAAALVLRERRIPYAWLTGYGVRGVPEALQAAPILDKPIDPDLFGDVVNLLLSPAPD